MDLRDEVIKFGKKLVYSGLTNSFFGNISVMLDDETILITRTGSMLDELENGLVEVKLNKTTENDSLASSELKMHREIYKKTKAKAIIHAHSPYAIAISLMENSKIIKFIDEEAKHLFADGVPVVTGKAGSTELAKNVSLAMEKHNALIIKGHGSVTAGKSLSEAYILVSALELCSKVKIISKQMS